MDGLYVLNSPIASADNTLATLRRDPLLAAPNSGVRWLMDSAFGFSYPGGAFVGRAAAGAPVNGTNVYDVSELSAAAPWVVAGGQTMAYNGGGFDFTNLTARGSYLSVPAAVANDIWTAYGGASQQLLICGYFKMPLLADWSANAAIAPMLSFAAANAGAGNADIVSMGQFSGGNLQAIRQTGGATLVTTQLNTAQLGAVYGSLAQFAFWRNAAGVGLSVRTVAGGRITATGAVGADNTENFSARDGRFGVSTAYWSAALVNQAQAIRFRMYRAFVENLARSGRDPVTVLDDDWTRVQARITASAAANGGTSIIFA